MPYTGTHMVMQWGGSFRAQSPTSQSLEIFTGALRFTGPGIEQSANQQVCDALAVVLSAYWRKSGSLIANSAFLEYVKWNRVGADGKYLDANTRIRTFTGLYGGGGKDSYPLQVSWATTWKTDVMRGKANRGRTYWPTMVPLGSGFVVGADDCRAKANTDWTLIQDLNAAARNGYVDGTANPFPAWAVAAGFAPATTREASGLSATVMSNIGAGTNRVITGAEVGQRLDIQRRRGNAQFDQRYANA